MNHHEKTEQKQLLKKATNINVILDGWTDVSKIHYVAVILKFDTNQAQDQYEYVDNLDLRLEDHHTAENQRKALMNLLDPY